VYVARVFISLPAVNKLASARVDQGQVGGHLRAVDSKGRVLAESSNGLLGFTAAHTSQTPQKYVLGFTRRDFRGQQGHGYSLQMGNIR